jgi:hypothetical protein
MVGQSLITTLILAGSTNFLQYFIVVQASFDEVAIKLDLP